MKKSTTFFAIFCMIIFSNFSSIKKNKSTMNNPGKYQYSERVDSFIRKEFDDIIKFLDIKITLYEKYANLSISEKNVFFEKTFDKLNEELEQIENGIDHYIDNGKNENTLIDEKIFGIIEKEGYLKRLIDKYEFLKNKCTLNANQKEEKTKKVEATLYKILIKLSMPIYEENKIKQAYNITLLSSINTLDWRFFRFLTDLYNDSLININEPLTVTLTNEIMIINEEKQEEDVFYKYIDIYKKYYGQDVDQEFRICIPRLTNNEIYLNTSEILNKGIEEWNNWRVKNEHLIPAIESYDFHDKDFIGGNFESMLFLNVDFKNAVLDEADFQNTTLIGCDLSNASLKNIKLSGAKADYQTKFPERFDTKIHGVTLVNSKN
jgi:hypothetical protein